MASARGSSRPLAIAQPLCLSVLLASSGCGKVEELIAKFKGDDVAETPKAAETPAETPTVAAPAKTDLNSLLLFLPDDKVVAVVLRDASMLPDLIEGTVRFTSGPMGRLAQNSESLPPDLRQVVTQYPAFEQQAKKAAAALRESKVSLDRGLVLFEVQGKEHIVFHGSDPAALSQLAASFGENGLKPEQCRAIEGQDGWNVCAQDPTALAAYKVAGDATPVRSALDKHLAGVDLEKATVLGMNLEGASAAITVDAGNVHAVIAPQPGSKVSNDLAQLQAVLAPGEMKTLGDLEPGAGFVWARTNPAMLQTFADQQLQGAPPEIVNVFKALTGEWAMLGSADPAGVVLRAGTTDAAGFNSALGFAYAMAAMAPRQIPQLPGAELVIDRASLKGDAEDALHVGLVGAGGQPLSAATMLGKAGDLHFDSWAFAAGDALNVVVAASRESAARFAKDATAGAPSQAALTSLPSALGESIKRNEVSFVTHLPLDVALHPNLIAVVEDALAKAPAGAPNAATVRSMLALAAPLSGATAWVSHPSGASAPSIHVSVQAIGHRGTEEGKAALDAAFAVSNGADSAATFKPLADEYPSSSMAHAYATRAGAPQALAASGWGPIAVLSGAAAFVSYAGNAAPAEPAEPEPEIVEPDAPLPVEPKKPTNKKKTAPKKTEPKKTEPKKTEPKKDTPIVEPRKPGNDRPKPPVPKPSVDPEKPTPRRAGRTRELR